jgi:membrane protease YdiL (CAAX protease family)
MDNNGQWFDFSGAQNGGFGYNNQLKTAQANEKRALFKNASFLGILLLLYNVYNYIFVRVFYFAAYSIKHGGFTLSLNEVRKYFYADSSSLGYSSSFSMTMNLAVVAASVIMLLLTAALPMRINVMSMLKPKKGCVKQGLKTTPMCLTLNMFISYIVAIFVATMSAQGVTVPEADFTINKPSTYAVVIQLVYVCVFAPIAEEIIYRGLVLKLLSPYGKGMAVFFSALLFGIMHGNIPQAVSAFAGGLIYAATAVYFDSIVPTIIIHVLNNCFASITDIGNAVGFDHAYQLYCALNIVIMFAGVYAIFVYLRGLIKGIRQSEPKCAMTGGARCITVATNVFMLIYFGLMIWQYVRSFLVYNQ